MSYECVCDVCGTEAVCVVRYVRRVLWDICGMRYVVKKACSMGHRVWNMGYECSRDVCDTEGVEVRSG